nr:EOG090X080D [Sida crystallina]
MVGDGIMFSTSTQRKTWMYRDESDIINARQVVNSNFIKSRKQNMSDAEVEAFFLTVSEERILALSSEYQLREFCRKFQPPMPRYVVGTAIHYLKRFYLNNSVMDYHPKEILVTCVYLASKVEEFNVSMDQFVGNLKGDREKAAYIILSNELLLMQQLNYHLTIHNPFRPLEGMMIDIKTRFSSLRDAERLRPGIDEFLEKVFYTDAILVYSPSQIALASIIHSASTLKENVDEYITRTLFGDDGKYLHNLVEAVKKIRVMVRSVEMPPRETIKVLERKLDACRNQDNNTDGSMSKKRNKEETFDDDDNDWEDIQHIEAILARHPSPPLPLPLPMSIFQQSSKDPISRTDPNSPSQSSTNDPSQLHQLSWVHCTRYRPPKLPRVKRETAYRTRYRNPRIPFSTTEVAALENKFRSSPYLGSHDVVELATDLNMSPKRPDVAVD